MKTNEKRMPKEMTLVGGGLNPEEQQRIFGARCVCSTGSANANEVDACQCDHGNENGLANYGLSDVCLM